MGNRRDLCAIFLFDSVRKVLLESKESFVKKVKGGQIRQGFPSSSNLELPTKLRECVALLVFIFSPPKRVKGKRVQNSLDI